MLRGRRAAFVAAFAACAAGAAGATASCSTSSEGPAGSSAPPGTPPANANPGESPASKDKPKDPGTQIMIGVDGEDFAGAGYKLTSLGIVAKVDGLVSAQKTVDAAAAPLFPHEIRLVAPASKTDAPVEVTVNAIMNNATVVTRRATTRFVPGKTKLAYVYLETRCNTFQLLGGGAMGPTCDVAGETCIAAKCRSDALPTLPDYAADWPKNPPSQCGNGAAQLVVGQGEAAFAPLADGENVVAECGPQGGHHLWMSLGMSGFRQVGTVTTLSAAQPGGGSTVPATAFPFALSLAGSGSCELVGLRFQLDVSGKPIADFLGKPLDVTVGAKDKAGHELTVVRRVVLAAAPTGIYCR